MGATAECKRKTRQSAAEPIRAGDTASHDASYIMVYFSGAREIELDTAVLRGERTRSWWYNPRDGSASETDPLPVDRAARVATPDDNSGRDWVLVVDDEDTGYSVPKKGPVLRSAHEGRKG